MTIKTLFSLRGLYRKSSIEHGFTFVKDVISFAQLPSFLSDLFLISKKDMNLLWIVRIASNPALVRLLPPQVCCPNRSDIVEANLADKRASPSLLEHSCI